jgi:sugar phosphate isomerase/epimerase
MRYISSELQSFAAYGTAKEIVKLYKESGFTAYDASMFTGGVFDEILYADNWQEKAREFRAYADGLGIVCNQTHAPFATARKGNEEYNAQMLPKIHRAIEVSGILGAKICVVHPCNDYTAEENAVLYKNFEATARKAGVKIAVENMWSWAKGSPTATPAACSHHDDFKKHLDLLPNDVFVACVDIGHAEMAGLDTSAAQMIKALGKRVECIHLHDVDGVHDNHQVPFTQSVKFADVIDALKEVDYQGDITLEVAYAPKKTPKALLVPLAKYLAEIANYFKNELDK